MRFDHKSRIKQSRDFLKVRETGRRIVHGCLIANWRELPGEGPARLGVVSSRKIGGAVVRNRARRLIREAFRLHRSGLAHSVDLVLVARPSIAGKSFASVEKDFLATLSKAGLLKQPPPA
jgi:ribonuclease P protein component